MNAELMLRKLRSRVPEFTADDLMLDLPYVVFGGFASFVIERLRTFGVDDPVVRRAFDFVNDAFVDVDHELVNVIETTLFEQLADDGDVARRAHALLHVPARQSLERVASWAGKIDLSAS